MLGECVIRLHDLKRMFRNPLQALETSEYLGASRRRGNPGVLISTLEIDTYMSEILRLYPQGTIDFYRMTLSQTRGWDDPDFSLEIIIDSIFRCRATRKKNTFYHGLQDPMYARWTLLISTNAVALQKRFARLMAVDKGVSLFVSGRLILISS